MNRQGLSWKAKLKYAIDQVVKESDDFADFLLKCAENGILVYYNPEHTIDLKFMLAEQKERNPRAKKLNKHIAELRKQSAQKKARYKGVKLKADELSQAANEIEQYLRQEQSRDQQKKKNRSVLE